jgi:hypothetical protein
VPEPNTPGVTEIMISTRPIAREGATSANDTPRARRREIWRALLILAGLAAFFYAPILLTLRTFPDGDFTHHFLPFSLFQQQELLAGRLPLWNSYTYSGHPFLADVQAAVYYPISNLLLALTLPLTDPAARLYFLQVEAIVQVALGGWFTYLLVRQLTHRHDAGLAAGLCFAFSGYLTGYPPVQLAVLRTVIWLPLILWALLNAVAAPRRWSWGWLGWWTTVGAAAAVSFLAGHAQSFLYIGYAALAWLIVLAGSRWRLLRQRGNSLAMVAGVLLATSVFFGLSAPQLLPGVEFARLSVRANVDYTYVSGGFPLQESWQMLLPGVLTVYSPLYIGVIGLGLAFVAVAAAVLRADWRPVVTAGDASPDIKVRDRTGVLFFLALATVALLLAYGGNSFLYPLAYRWAPGFDLFRGQERAAFLVAFGLSVLAGYGLLAARLLPVRVRGWLATLYAGLVIGGVYLFGLLWQLPGRTAVGQERFLLLAALTIGLVAGFALLLRRPGWSRERTFLIGLLAFANLFWANNATNLGEFSPARKVILAPEVAAVQQVAGAPGFSTQKRRETEARGEEEQPAPGRIYNEFRAYEDYGMRVGVEDVWGSSPLRLARYARLFDAFPLDRMWRLLGVAHVLTWRRDLFGPSTLLGEFPQPTDTTYLHRLAQMNPRAWVAPAAVVADDEAAVVLLADHGFDLEQTAILSSAADLATFQEAVQLPGRAGEPASADVRLHQRAPGQFTVAAESAASGLLLISENWMPGWRIIVKEWPEDASAPLTAPLRTNLTLLGVPIPAGRVTFDLIYQPDSVRDGLWIGGVTLSLLALGGLFAAWRTIRTRSAQ